LVFLKSKIPIDFFSFIGFFVFLYHFMFRKLSRLF